MSFLYYASKGGDYELWNVRPQEEKEEDPEEKEEKDREEKEEIGRLL
jgi:hypothetical protein